MRIIHNIIQGSDEWHQFRLEHHGASEAAAMLGLSKKVKRNELLHMKHTGIGKEFTAWVQANILDYGHEVEALARPRAEWHIEDDLYPVTCSLGKLSASCDGLTMDETLVWEHKQWNAELAASVAAGVLPEEHMPQCQQELLTTGAERLIFTVSDGTPENMVHMEVLPSVDWFTRIIEGWNQFNIDLADYSPIQHAEKPQPDAIKALPALIVQIKGEVAHSNLPMFQAAAARFIASIKTDLTTDEDFVNAEATAKYCQEAEDNLDAAKKAAIAQTASIDDLMRTVDLIRDQLRAKRLALGKLVDKRKAEIKEAILLNAKTAFADHVAALEKEIAPTRLTYAMPDFGGAMKNKRTLASLHDAVDTLLASSKIATNATAADYRAKLAWCKEAAAGYGFLFMDLPQIIGKAMDDFKLVVTTRIEQHQRAEAAKAEALRAKIADEERVKAEAAAAETLRIQQAEIATAEAARVALEAEERARADADAQRVIDEAAAATAQRHADQPAPHFAPVSDRGGFVQIQGAKRAFSGPGDSASHFLAGFIAAATNPAVSMADEPAAPAPQAAPIAPAPDGPPTLPLGSINERLLFSTFGFSMTARFLDHLGFKPAALEKAAKLYHERQFPEICDAFIAHIESVKANHEAQS